MIPKVVYQTWKTKVLPTNVINTIKNMKSLNPDYDFYLYDDNDIEKWIKSTFDDPIIYNTYSQLNVGAAKADFWRYLILYKNGGIYLDIDSEITKPLNELINENDTAIVSREKNSGTTYFIQWCLIFSKGHPILKRAIDLCIRNINNRLSFYLPTLTGPAVFTQAIHNVLKSQYNISIRTLIIQLMIILNNSNTDLNNSQIKKETLLNNYRTILK